MRHTRLPTGITWDDFLEFTSLSQAQSAARTYERKLWCRIDGAQNHRVEVYPGGRSIAWPLDALERRRERMMPLAEGHKCKHAWETHSDSDPCGAGVHVESYRQCLKCGQIRESC